MGRIVRFVALLAALVGVRWTLSVRDRAEASGRPAGDVMSQDLRNFVTHRFDPLVMRLGLVGGRVSPWAVMEHVGRTSGAVHRTPVTPRVHEDRMFIPLPYGTDVQWLRNVQATGHCRVQFHETIYELDEPAIITPDELTGLPEIAHEALDMSGRHYLRLHVLDRAPGTFANPPAEFTTHPARTGLPEIEMVPRPAEATTA
jgi:hypothetical protein